MRQDCSSVWGLWLCLSVPQIPFLLSQGARGPCTAGVLLVVFLGTLSARLYTELLSTAYPATWRLVGTHTDFFLGWTQEYCIFGKNKDIGNSYILGAGIVYFLKCFYMFLTLKKGQSKIQRTQQMFTVKPETFLNPIYCHSSHFRICMRVMFSEAPECVKTSPVGHCLNKHPEVLFYRS